MSNKAGYSSKGKFEVGDGVTVGGMQVLGAPAANIPQVSTANGSDAATTQALANALKASHNLVLTALKAHGIIVPDA